MFKLPITRNEIFILRGLSSRLRTKKANIFISTIAKSRMTEAGGEKFYRRRFSENSLRILTWPCREFVVIVAYIESSNKRSHASRRYHYARSRFMAAVFLPVLLLVIRFEDTVDMNASLWMIYATVIHVSEIITLPKSHYGRLASR